MAKQQQQSAAAHSIADAAVIKDEDLFFLTDRNGSVPLHGNHGFGLYYHDCRFLNGYQLQLTDQPPPALASTAEQGFRSTFALTNPAIQIGKHAIKKDVLGITWEHVIDEEHLTLCDTLTFRNNGAQPLDLPLTLTMQAQFEDVFAVRGTPQKKRGKLHKPSYDDGVLRFVYDGADDITRVLRAQFWPAPQQVKDATAQYQLTLQPGQQQQVQISLTVSETSAKQPDDQRAQHPPAMPQIEKSLRHLFDDWLTQHTTIQASDATLHHLLDRSLRDLRMLRSHLNQQEFFAAGVPWFVTLFGRDSLIAALQTLAYDPQIAEQTLRLLASFQGQQRDEHRAEQPGKIMHELRVGEMAHLNEIPQTPYYGTVDATPLFLILVARHAAWTGDLALFNDLRSNIDRALDWMDQDGGISDDGFLRYNSGASGGGLGNQGWKDSGDAIVNADGSLATPPIALVEVQGYAYMAKMGLADLFERAGEHDRAEQLQREAAALRERFNRDFWLEEQGCYALALQNDGRPAAVITSNPGQALWTGIADADKARRTAERLVADDMFNGWGIRTLSAQEQRYNPVGYHLGTIWPHDNSIIVAGLRRYGHDDAARRVFGGISAAASHFTHGRLPEVFAGFPRSDFGKPVHYPVACHPQAWAAGTMPFLMETMLGLQPEAFEQRLRIVRPLLPDGVQSLEVQHLRVGAARVHMRFERTASGVAVQTLKIDGQLDIIVEPVAQEQGNDGYATKKAETDDTR